MNSFTYVSPKDLADASKAIGPSGKLLAGGIDLLTELKEGLIQPQRIVNLKSVSGLNDIGGSGDFKIGALVTLADLAANKEVRSKYPAIAEAAESVGSPQIRNVGTVGGNLCQRPRCWYYRDAEVHCLKKGGDRCYAVEGENEYHAILGGGPCHIVHPSDLAPALIALDAQVEIFSNGKTRKMPLGEFFQLPRDNVYSENVLKDGEIVTAVTLPKAMAGWKSSYYKIKERESFDWALASAAVAMEMKGTLVTKARVVLGGVAPIPWRSQEAEKMLEGKNLSTEQALQAGVAAVANATPMSGNAYKEKLAASAVGIAALTAAGMEAK
jgi:xanthine dehydrogenase YagS FAD-binding subunit